MSGDDNVIHGWNEPYMKGSKRTHIGGGDETMLDDWFVGWGKDRGCQFEGSWYHMMMLAAKILSSENTKQAVDASDEIPDELYLPELREIADENYMYTGAPYEFESRD